MKGKTAAVLLLIVLAVAGAGYWLWHAENYDEFFYAKVRDPQVKELSSKEEMKYEYTLEAFNVQGKEKKLTFKSVDPLNNGEYLKIEVLSTGVHHFDRISYADIPARAQAAISKTQ